MAIESSTVGESHPFYESLNEIHKNKMLEVINLKALSRKHFFQLREELCYNSKINDEIVSYIYNISGGSPMALKEIMENSSGLFHVEELFDNYEKLPAFILRDKMDNSFFHLLAIYDRRVEKKCVQEIVDEGLVENDIMNCNPIIYNEDDRTFCFSHPLYKKFLYDNITCNIKKDFHKKIAFREEKKIDINAGKIDFSVMARTGYHFFMGDVLPRAFHYLVELNSIVFSAGAYRGSLIMTEMLMEKLLAR